MCHREEEEKLAVKVKKKGEGREGKKSVAFTTTAIRSVKCSGALMGRRERERENRHRRGGD